MACNECGQTTNCIEPCVGADCACVISDQSSDCTLYTGEDLACSGIISGTTLTETIQGLDAHICSLFSTVTSGFNIINIGTGSEVFKQNNNLGQRELRSLVSGDASVTITQNADEINLSIAGVSGEANTGSNVGGQVELFKQKSLLDLEFRTIQGTGNTNIALNGDIVEVSSTPYTGSNLGGGQEIFKQVTANDFEHRTLVGSGDINVTTIGDTIQISNTPSVEQIERNVDFTLDDSMNEQVIFVSPLNVLTTLNITVPSTLSDNFKCGFVQQSVGTVNFITSGTAVLNSANGTKIEGLFYQSFVQKRNAGTDEFILLGNTKV